MKRWALLTVALYGLALVVLTFPVLVVFTTELFQPEGRSSFFSSASEALRIYREWGLVTGLSVMLLAFGPAVFFLFAQRFRQLHPRPRGDSASSLARD